MVFPWFSYGPVFLTTNHINDVQHLPDRREISQALDPTIPNGFMDQVGGIVGSTAKLPGLEMADRGVDGGRKTMGFWGKNAIKLVEIPFIIVI